MPVYIVLLSKAIQKVPAISRVLSSMIHASVIHGMQFMWPVHGVLFNAIGVHVI